MSAVQVAPPIDQALYQPAKDGDAYTWAGQKYVRVSAVLGVLGGDALLSWYAKQGCLRTLAPLVHAGLVPTDCDSELHEFVEAEPIRALTAPEAILQAANWHSNYKEGYRYRDHKGRIGTLVHRAKHDHALGLRHANLLEYLTGLAAKPGFIPDDVIERFAMLGKSHEDVARDLAYAAVPYTKAAFQYVEDFEPEYVAIGLESAIANWSEEYMGTADGWAWHTKAKWEKLQRPWPANLGDRAMLLEDYKTSNSLSPKFKQQLAAYMFAENICLFGDGSLHPVPHADAAILVHIKPGTYGLQVWDRATLADVFERSFLALLDHWRLENDKPRPLNSRRVAKPKPPKRGNREVPF